jgi:hypothetical protein
MIRLEVMIVNDIFVIVFLEHARLRRISRARDHHAQGLVVAANRQAALGSMVDAIIRSGDTPPQLNPTRSSLSFSQSSQ